MGLFSGVSKAFKKVGRGITGQVKKALKKVKQAASFVKKKWGEFTTEMGPLGTMALIVAMPYLASWASTTYASWGATTTAGAATVEGVVASAAGASSSVASGAIGISEGITAAATAGEATAFGGALTASGQQAAMLAEQTAVFGAAGEALTTEALLTATGGQQAAMLAAQTADFGQAGIELTQEAAATSSPLSVPFDSGSLAKSALSLLGGQPEQGMGGLLPTVPPPALQRSEAIKSISAGVGGGLGFSRFTEESAADLVAGARQAEERYKTLLSRGI